MRADKRVRLFQDGGKGLHKSPWFQLALALLYEAQNFVYGFLLEGKRSGNSVLWRSEMMEDVT